MIIENEINKIQKLSIQLINKFEKLFMHFLVSEMLIIFLIKFQI